VQPDEDDYGYVSQEASAFYNKLMEKYTSTPLEEPKFSKKSLLKSSAADLNNTKVYKLIVATIAHMYIKVSLYTQSVLHVSAIHVAICRDTKYKV